MWIPTKEQALVGDVLEKARKRSGLTQQQLARKLKKPQSFVSDYEAGQRRIDVLEFIQIAKTIGAAPGQLFRAVLVRR